MYMYMYMEVRKPSAEHIGSACVYLTINVQKFLQSMMAKK